MKTSKPVLRMYLQPLRLVFSLLLMSGFLIITPEGRASGAILPPGLQKESAQALPGGVLETDRIIVKYEPAPQMRLAPTQELQMARLSLATGVQVAPVHWMSGGAQVIQLSSRLPAAWDITTGSSSLVMAVVDIGITNHADLSGRSVPGYDFISAYQVANDGNNRASDPEPGDKLTWSLLTPPVHGAASASGTGPALTVGYDPEADYHGPDSFAVQVTDGASLISTTVSVTVNPVYDPPSIAEGEQVLRWMSVNGSPQPFDLTLHASSPDAVTFTWSISSPSSHGAASAAGQGTSMEIGYVPDVGYVGWDSFAVQVSDGVQASSITVLVNVYEPERISPGSVHTCGVRADGSLLCWGRNLHGQATPPTGSFTQVNAGDLHTCGLKTDRTLACWGDSAAIQGTPSSGEFTQVSAGSGFSCAVGSSGGLVCWGANDYGQATPEAGTFSQVSAGYRHACGILTDGSLACWGYNHLGQASPPAGSFIQVSAGVDFTCGVKSDGSLACWGLNASGQSNPPGGIFAQVSSGHMHACAVRLDGALLCWGVTAEYAPPTPTVETYTQVSAWSYHTCALDGSDHADCWGHNGFAQSNPPPVILEGEAQSVIMSENGSPIPFDLELHAWDWDDDNLSWSVRSAPAHGAAVASGTGISQTVQYTPTAHYYGSDSFVVQVFDGEVEDRITVNVIIEMVNLPPMITEGEAISVTMDEDGVPTPFALTLHASDPNPRDTLTWSLSQPAGHGTASASGVGASLQASYISAPNYFGADTFRVQVTDGMVTDSITVSVIISAVNDAPVIAEGDSAWVTMDEDGAPRPFSLTLHASDGDEGSALTWSLSISPTHGAAGASGVGAALAVSYSPAVNYHGADTFAIQVSDGVLTDSLSVYVTIDPVNDALTILEGSVVTVTMDEDGAPISFTLTLHAADPDGVASINWSIQTPPTHGSAAAEGSGEMQAVTYTPQLNYYGSDAFVVRASNEPDVDEITIHLSISPVNDLPVVAEGSSTIVGMNKDGAPQPFNLTLHASDVDVGDSLTWSLVQAAEHGAASASGAGSLLKVGYFPQAGFIGLDSFTVQVTDSQGGRTAITVIIYVYDLERLSGGAVHTCLLNSDNSLTCIGANYKDQTNAPTGAFTQVSAGFEHNCALRSDGTLACWGATTNAPAGTYLQVSAGGSYSCAVASSGSLACWGIPPDQDNFGQATPKAGTFSQVSACWRHTCGILTDGSLVCWGWNAWGQLNVPAGTYLQVSASWWHSCALKSDGTIACWGDNRFGVATPPAGKFIQVSAGKEHTCALRSDGTLACWGNNALGQADAPAGMFIQVSAGHYHTCARKANGSVVCWGDNSYGQTMVNHLYLPITTR